MESVVVIPADWKRAMSDAPQATLPVDDVLPAAIETLAMLEDTLRGFRFRFTSEDELQAGMEAAFVRRGVSFVRERALTPQDRPDFLVPCAGGQIAVEVKIKGTFAQALRQVARYNEHPAVMGVLLTGSPRWVDTMPDEIGGKPVRSVHLMAAF